MRAKGEVLEPGFYPPLYSLGPPLKVGASVKVLDLGRERNTGTTPRDRDKQCDVCGVERIAYFGLDIVSGIRMYVGERCYYMVKRDPEGAIPLD
jgi:hypothetical protein